MKDDKSLDPNGTAHIYHHLYQQRHQSAAMLAAISEDDIQASAKSIADWVDEQVFRQIMASESNDALLDIVEGDRK